MKKLLTIITMFTSGLLLTVDDVNAQFSDCSVEPVNMNVSYDAAISCSFEANDDIDIYRFMGSEGDHVTISALDNDLEGSILPRIELSSPTGETLGDISKTLMATLTETGVHTILIKHRLNDLGAYTMELICAGGPCIDGLFPGSNGEANKAIFNKNSGTLTIPVLSINGGPEFTVELGLPFNILTVTPR